MEFHIEHEESGEPKSRLPEDEDRQRNAARMQELNDLSNFAQKTYEDMMGKKENTKEDTEDKKPSFMEMMNQLRHLGPLLKDAQFTRWVICTCNKCSWLIDGFFTCTRCDFSPFKFSLFI